MSRGDSHLLINSFFRRKLADYGERRTENGAVSQGRRAAEGEICQALWEISGHCDILKETDCYWSTKVLYEQGKRAVKVRESGENPPKGEEEEKVSLSVFASE